MCRREIWRPMDRPGEEAPYKSFEANGSVSCSSSICQGQEVHGDSGSPRQHDSSSIHKSLGGNEITRFLFVSSPSVGQVPSETSLLNGIPYSRCKQHQSRSAVQISSRQTRLAAESRSIQEDRFSVGSIVGGRLCLQDLSTDRFFSWKQDPLAEAVDAFSQDWTTFTGYANPPWSLVGRCIQQVLNQGATIVLITPLWPTQARYPALFPLLIDNPRLIPRRADLLISPQGYQSPLPEKANGPVVWFISGDHLKAQEFQKK